MKFAIRLLGTVVFTIVTAGVLGAGLWLMGALLWTNLPPAVAIPAIIGLAISPPMLFSDLLQLLREDDLRRAEKTRASDEAAE